MEKQIIDSIWKNLFYTRLLIQRKILNIKLEGIQKEISRPHYSIITTLDESGILTISEIGKKTLITKPQMTHLVDRLIKLGLVERLPDTNDRRRIKIVLTNKGKAALEERRQIIKTNLNKMLSCLNDEELKEFSKALQTVRAIATKLK
ncbi:MarR family winged helix-turn-helix transcriptional regulator [Chloroflexota bacterium]